MKLVHFENIFYGVIFLIKQSDLKNQQVIN